jgi:trehalose synthase-fused probable maltokinase
MAPKPAIDRRLQQMASAFTPEWLAGQRWYRTKSREVATVALFDAAAIEGSAGWLLVLDATDTEGATSRYQVPAVADESAFREPRDGDGVWRRLGALTLAGGELEGTRGRWSFTPTAVAERLSGGVASLAELPERRLGVQQSNSSIALGDRLILKVYRLLEPGLNPEVEVNAFLTSVGFSFAPALGGSVTYVLGGEAHAASMLQELVPSAGDGWTWLLDRLAALPEGPNEALPGIAQVGRLTAAMHAALASRPVAPAFPSRLATNEERSAWAEGATRRLDEALAVLTGSERSRLSAIGPRMAGRFEALAGGGEVKVSRIHGDYHLGQLLKTSEGFSVIDFEGEPARPLAERRAPSSPLRDVAGMLRSLDYAARTGSRQASDQEAGVPWLKAARTAFLEGYGGIRAADRPLLAAFELEKACYEVVYEANNRPDWVWLPLEALERLGVGA